MASPHEVGRVLLELALLSSDIGSPWPGLSAASGRGGITNVNVSVQRGSPITACDLRLHATGPVCEE
jgi:hypothetical protein